MSKSRTALAALLLLMAGLAGLVRPHTAPTSTSAPEADPWFSEYRLGTVWVYTTGMSNDSAEVVTRVDHEPGARLVSITCSVGWIDPDEHRLRLTSDGLFAEGLSGERFDPPICLLRRGCRAGDHWETRTRVTLRPADAARDLRLGTRDELWAATVYDTEEVQVPAGRLMALRVEYAITPLDPEYTRLPERWDVWFTPGVGRVRSVYERLDNGLRVRSVEMLKRFAPGRP